MRSLYVGVAFCAILLLTFFDGITNSSQPPTGRTGAPGELTCNASGCHNSTSVIPNSASLTMTSLGGNVFQTGYTPGQTYNLAFTNSFSSSEYGFSITFLDTSTTTAVTPGSFSLSNPANTTLSNSGSRSYVGHNNASGTNAWAFRWTAPSTNAPDTIYIYAASNAANGNGNAGGDVIHTKQFFIPIIPPVQSNPCADVFISEYVEGSGFNKSIEIYNPTSSPIDLSTYRLEKYTNGSSTPGTPTPLSGVLQPYDVRVFTVDERGGSSPPDAALQAVTDSFMNTNSGTEPMYFNGDDALVLLNSSNDTIDIIGKIGEDPGSAWNSGGVSTANQTLVRKPWVQEGVTSNPAAFDPSQQWIGYPQNFFDSLGTHRSVCAPTFCNAFSATVTATTDNDCFGDSNGSVSITANNSSGFFTINGNLNNLSAGNYTYDVYDSIAACTTSVNFTIAEPLLLTVTAGSSPENCSNAQNGVVWATASGGTGPYTYDWGIGLGDTIPGLSVGNYNVTVTDDNGCTATAGTSISLAPAPTVTLAKTDASCAGVNNGKVWATPNGGSAPYTYTWSVAGATDTISNLSPGTYSVTVTGAFGCTATASISVSQGSGPQVSIAEQDASCPGVNNGSATATGNNSTPPYNYLWSTGATTATASNLAPGTYTVTVTDAGGCTVTGSASIAAGTPIDVNLSSTPASCAIVSNGTATAAGTNGTSPYSYLWSSGSTTATAPNLSAGLYEVTVTDFNGCTVSDTISVGQGSGPTVSITSTDASCSGVSNGTATATGSSTPGPYTYLWSTGATTATASNLAPGTYTVTVTDANGCTVADNTTVGQGTGPSVTATATATSCPGVNNGTATATGTGGTAPYTYAWSSGSNNATATGLAPGSYTVTATDVNGCSNTTSVTVTQGTALSITLQTLPESCNGALDGQAWVEYNNGTAPYTVIWSNSATTDTISGLDNGSYSISVEDANGCQATGTTTVAQNNGTASQPGAITLADTICLDGSGYPVSVANVPGVTYTWSISAGGGLASSTTNSTTYTPSTTGTYTISVTASNICGTSTASTTDVYVFEPTTPVIDGIKDVCTGVTSYIVTNPNSQATYSWSVTGGTVVEFGDSAVVTFTTAGTQTVSVTANYNQCNSVSLSDDLSINVSQGPVAGFTYNIATGNVVTFTNTSSGADSYSWDFGNSTTDTATSPVVDYGVTADGEYIISLTATNDCSSDVFTDTITLVGVGINYTALAGLEVYPNPVQQQLTVTWANAGTPVQLTLMNTLGEQLINQQVAATETSAKLNTLDLASGMYLLHVKQGEFSQVYKVFKE